ncbi:MAG: hypothetical protein HY860_04955 [Chlamydiales bacterium]|nr:hypothetical protein [Chlamydiales bacterium]
MASQCNTNCICAAILAPALITTNFLAEWRDDNAHDSCIYGAFKRAVTLPIGLIASIATLVEGVVWSVFALLLLPLACCAGFIDKDAGDKFSGVLHGVVLLHFTLGGVGVISSITQVATDKFLIVDC